MEELEDFTDDELKDELEDRGYYVYEEEPEEYDEDEMYDAADDRYRADYFVLKKDYMHYQLRDFLADIAECNYNTSDEELLNKLKQKMTR